MENVRIDFYAEIDLKTRNWHPSCNLANGFEQIRFLDQNWKFSIFFRKMYGEFAGNRLGTNFMPKLTQKPEIGIRIAIWHTVFEKTQKVGI